MFRVRPPLGARLPLFRSLRARLLAGLLVLLAVCCAAVGVATVLSLHRFLVNRLDEQLVAAAGRFPASLKGLHGSTAGSVRADTRGQAAGTLGLRVAHGRITRAVVVTDRTDGSAPLGGADRRALARVPTDHRGHTLDLARLGPYRVLAVPGGDGDTLVTGYPLADAEDAVQRLEVIEAIVFGAALLATGVSGAVWVRLALRPLRRVAATAGRVAELPLGSGEATVPERVPDADTDPGSEVGRVGAALNRMLGHVENALAQRQEGEQRLRRFAADASHELRTPVAAIRGHAELARRHPAPVPPEVRHALERIQAESRRMGGIVDDLLLLARLDAGRPLAREPVDLSLLLLDAAGDARAAGPGHRWVLDLPEEPVSVPGDEHRLQQVVANLLANARTHTPPGTVVTARVVRGAPGAPPLPADAGGGRRAEHGGTGAGGTPGGCVELTVVDDGPGIPAELLGDVFGRFVRAAPGRPQPASPDAAETGGTGLGLAIVQAVVAAHGGTVAVRSAPGATEFVVRLPA